MVNVTSASPDCPSHPCNEQTASDTPDAEGINDEHAGLVSHVSELAAEASDSRVALLVIAHTPLASALKDVARHVFCEDVPLSAIDVLPGACAQDSSDALVKQLVALNRGEGVLIMTDLPGASPSNVCASAAAKVRELGIPCLVVTGVNVAMVLRALSYRGASDLEAYTSAVLAGASQAVMRLD